MGRYLTAKVLSILLASSYVFATPTPAGSSIELEELLPITTKLKSKGLEVDLTGLEWSVLKIKGAPVFDTYHVAATGMETTFFADLAIDKTNEIMIADGLCNKQTQCNKRITDLVKAFMDQKDIKMKPKYLAINNIQEKDTVPILAQLPTYGSLPLTSALYGTLTTDSPLGRLGASAKLGGPPKAVYIGDVAASQKIAGAAASAGSKGGSSMIFFYTAPPPGMKTIPFPDISGSVPNYAPGIVPAPGGNAAFEEARRKERVQAQQQANRTPGPSGGSSSSGCNCSTAKCSCSAMKRDSFPNNSRFKRAVEECPPCCAAAC